MRQNTGARPGFEVQIRVSVSFELVFLSALKGASDPSPGALSPGLNLSVLRQEGLTDFLKTKVIEITLVNNII